MARIPKGQRTKAQQSDADTKLSRFRGQYLAFYDASAILRTTVDDNVRLNRGGRDQWDAKDIAILEKDKTNPRPIQSFNLCGANVNFVAGYEWDKHQDFRFFPRGAEDEHLGRIATAEAKYAMDIGQGDAQMHRWFRRGIAHSLSTMHLCLNYNYTDDLVEGDLDFEVLSENSDYWDVFSRRYDKQDAQYQGNLFFMPIKEAVRKWKQHEAKLTATVAQTWLEQDDALTGVPSQLRAIFYRQDTEEIRILRHYYREPMDVVLLWNKATNESERFDSGQKAEEALKAIRDQAGEKVASMYALQQTDTQTVLMNQAMPSQMMAFPTPEDAQQEVDRIKDMAGTAAANQFTVITRPTTLLRVAHFCGWELLDDSPSPYGRVDEDGAMLEADWRYPYVRFIPYQDTDDFASIKGILNDLRDPQRELNWDHSTMLDEMVHGPKGGWWIPKAEHADIQIIKKQLPRAGFVLEFGAQKPIYEQPVPFAQVMVPKMQIEMEAMMRISGINAELMGQTTQKTVSGRAIGARQSGGLVGLNSLFVNWHASKKLFGELLIRRIQQFYSVAKMHRILGQDQMMAKEMGLFGPQSRVRSDDEVLAQLKSLKQLEFDVHVDFQDASPSARSAVFAQMLQGVAAGFPIPPDIIAESSDWPRKDEIIAAIKKQGNMLGPPNESLGKIIGAGQGGGGQPDGVNKG